jgi:ankyrin repeat protein
MKTGVNFSLQDEKGDTPLHLALKQAIKVTSNTGT